MNFVRNVILPGRTTVNAGSNTLAQSAAKLEIRTLSSRHDLVSGGDALNKEMNGFPRLR